MTRSPIIDREELAELLVSPEPPALLDVRFVLSVDGGGPTGRAAFEEGHLFDAQFVDLDVDLADPPGERGRHPLPDPGRFAAAMRRVGVRMDRAVVVYDQADGSAAARAWWLLTHHGHDDVRVLDGGYDGWVAAGGNTTALVQSVEAGDFVARPGRRKVLDVDGTAALAREGLLLDARQPERYRGEVEPIDPVAGHIPGAVSASTRDNVTADGRWRSADDLRERFAALGAGTAGEIGAYCGSGVTAAHEVLALELAGYDAALYPGSWSEWVADPARPVATGGA
ncbi:sulfurtransferase [Solicola gregarius]|uniref:Sulfurtransferase n=1 Tax=Solicola gregarius TaxID=2908642 RepID=A0AA46TI36_9ACTN|nr:sulfurtransferase [Solicola gregarius]UYM05269.1 sulfurtransferase [Solicola gregarius]